MAGNLLIIAHVEEGLWSISFRYKQFSSLNSVVYAKILGSITRLPADVTFT